MTPGDEFSASKTDTRMESSEKMNEKQESRNSDGTNRRPLSEISRSTSSSSSNDYGSELHTMHSRPTEPDLERRRTRMSDALSRIETQRYQHALTVGESVRSRASRASLPPFGGGKPYPPPLPAREEYVVEFDGTDDPLYPQNWSLGRK